MKHGIVIACMMGLVIAGGAYAADDSTNAPPVPHRPMRPMVDNLLGPRILDELALTSDQQTKYNALDANFKNDVAKWRANNSQSGSTNTNAAAGGNRQELRTLRRSYIEKLRTFLTADQNAKLTQWIENGPGRGRRGGGPEGAGNPPPQPPPAGSPPPQPPTPGNN
jgi:Spy/CpxP family protein refolding chaperone